MSTLLASNRIPTLQRNTAVTIATKVVDGRSLTSSSVSLFAACDGDAAAGGGWDVGFARGHGVCVCGFRGCVVVDGFGVGVVGCEEEAEKCNCEARNIWRPCVEGGGRIYGGDKGLVTCEDGFFLCESLVGFFLEYLISLVYF